jgi:hypothetical protein
VSGERKNRYSDDDLYDKGVFDHIKKKVETKNTAKVASGGISTPVKGFLLAVVIFSGLLFSGVLTGDAPFSTNNNSGPSDGPIITDGGQSSDALLSLCIQHTNLGAHYHYTVEIQIDTVPFPIPGNIGITENCMKPVHTHEPGGYIHNELPASYTGSTPTLGDFFSVWGQVLSDNNLVGYDGSVQMTLNSAPFTGTMNNYAPSDGDVILLSVTTTQ